MNAFENQFSSLANIAAILALIPEITIIKTNNSSGSSSGSILIDPILNPSVSACIPIHRLVDAIPKAAKLPDFLCKAKPCTNMVAINIITAIPISPKLYPVAEPIASKISVDCAAIAS